MRSDQYARAVGTILYGEPEERLSARLDVIRDVAEHLEADYREEPCPGIPDELDLLRGAPREVMQTALAANAKLASSFGAYRLAVSDVEARNARRLLVLADAVKVCASHSRAFELGATIMQWVEREWRTDVPLNADLRAWSARITRRYDLLPKDWRFVHS